VPSLLVLHGPNLQALGAREPVLYGTLTLAAINERLVTLAVRSGVALQVYQSNIQAKEQHTDFIVINPAAYGHTSIALRDALLAVSIPFIEVHLSNTYARESFRQRSYLADIATGVIIGLGVQSYELAVEAACQRINNEFSQ